MTDKENKLIDRVKTMMGGDVVKIEIPDESIYKLLEIALETVSPYISDTVYRTIPFRTSTDLSDWNCEEVLRVIPGSQIISPYGVGDEFNFGFTRWTTMDSLRTYNMYSKVARSVIPDVNVPFDYDRVGKTLYMTPGVTTKNVTVEYIPKVFSLDDLQEEGSVKWVYLYTLALTKEVIGRIRSKAKSQNVPIQLDGDTLLAEAAEEKLKLERSLIDDSLGPVNYLR